MNTVAHVLSPKARSPLFGDGVELDENTIDALNSTDAITYAGWAEEADVRLAVWRRGERVSMQRSQAPRTRNPAAIPIIRRIHTGAFTG